MRLFLQALPFAYIASVACAIHCALTPFIVISVPFMASFQDNVWIQLSLLITSIASGIAIVYSGYCKHRQTHSLILFALGSGVWITNSALMHFKNYQSDYSLFLGLSFVLLAYYLNHRYLQCCSTCSSTDK